MKHLQRFGLSGDPFSNEPDLRLYLDTPAHHDAYQRVERAIRQTKGLCVFSGDAGAGKTFVLRRVLESLEDEMFEAILLVLVPGAVDGASMLRRFGRQLGVEEPAADQTALVAQLYERLSTMREEGRHTVLTIDNAHLLEQGDDLLDVVGLLSLEYEEQRLLSVVLVGLPQIEVLMARHQGVADKVDVVVRLAGLDRESGEEYLAHRIQSAGGTPQILPRSAVDHLLCLSGGNPGQLNRLADNALFEAFLAGRTQVSREDVERAGETVSLKSDDSDAPSLLQPAPERRGPVVVENAPGAYKSSSGE